MKYRVSIQYSPEDGGYIATAPELPGCSAFGETLEEAARELGVAANAWVGTARNSGREVPEPSTERPYSGKLVLRMPPELHRALDRAAADAQVSLNQYLVYLLARAMGRLDTMTLSGYWAKQVESLSKEAWKRFHRRSVPGDIDTVRESFDDAIHFVMNREPGFQERWTVATTARNKTVPARDKR